MEACMKYPFDEFPEKASDWREAVRCATELRTALQDCVDELESLNHAHDSDYARPDEEVIKSANKILADIS